MLQTRLKLLMPFAATLLLLIATALQLHHQGRIWFCDCGHFLFWSGQAWSPETSQQLLDPYSFTHILHGMLFCGILAWVIPKLAVRWRFFLAILIEALWEMLENTNAIIERYREATAALGYQGDTVINSLGDVLACALGFWLANALGLRRSAITFVLVEAVLLLSIRDSLILNIVMLIYPSHALKIWQGGH
ncbi:MAG TPA: DUF2585 family protein [Pyrinomonadaceae bacterium]